MKKKFLLFCLFLIAFSGQVRAQTSLKDSVQIIPEYRNGVYLEMMGNAGIGSLNYERLVYLSATAPTIAFRIGMIPMPARENSNTSYFHLFMPLEITFLPGKKNFTPEFGAGLTIFNTYTKNKLEANEFSQDLMPVFRFGFRWGVTDNPVFFRAAMLMLMTGSVEDFEKGSTLPWPSFCVGYRFGKR